MSSNIYTRTFPAVFPHVIPCTEAEANSLVRILLRNDKNARPGREPYGTSYAYTANFFNQMGGDLWLSRASADRLEQYSTTSARVRDLTERIYDSSELYETE